MPTKVSSISIHLCRKFDMICLSETCLNSEIPSDNRYLKIHSCNLIKEDHPSNGKCCRFCVYYKSSLSFEVGLSPSKNICVTCLIKSLLEIMINLFILS